MLLLKDISFLLKQKMEGKEDNIYVLIKHIVPNQKNRKSADEDMYRICHTREKEEKSGKKQKKSQIAKNILQEDGL